MKAIETGNEFPSNYNPRETGGKIVDLLKSGAQALPLLASLISYWEYRLSLIHISEPTRH